MSHKLYLYPGWLRIWHGLNGLLCLVLILTGISMQFSSPGSPLIHFKTAVSLHNTCGIILSAVYMVFLFGNLLTKNGKQYKIRFKGMKTRLLKQIRYYTFGIFMNESAPYPVTHERKFNPMQQVTYSFIMYIGMPLIIISGWFMLFPEVVLPLFEGINGVFTTAVIHTLCAFFVFFFLIIHLYFCTIGYKPYSNFKSMVNGWHEAH